MSDPHFPSSADIVERIRSRIHNAPMPTEHLLDEAADTIEALKQANNSWADLYGPDAISGVPAQPEQQPVAYQFRQRSAVGKGPQSSLPWCDWVCIEREDYERYLREPNKLVQVRPLFAAQPPAAPVEADGEKAARDYEHGYNDGVEWAQTHGRCSAGTAEPVAWRWRINGNYWSVSARNPGPDVEGVEPLYSAVPQTSGKTGGAK